VVLAGGNGRRMGGAKPLRPLAGRPLVQHALRLARSYAAQVAVAVREPGQVGEAQAMMLADDESIGGPLGGVSAALRRAAEMGAGQVLTIPCDAPRLPSDLADRLAAELASTPAALAAFACAGEDAHWDCTLWRAEALGALSAFAAGGGRSLRGLVLACHGVPVSWTDASAFQGANTPEELAALEAAWGRARN